MLPSDSKIDEIMVNSYKNFHSEGLDYVCLHRTPAYTVKAYFFDDAKPEIVVPHNHRYSFTTTVLKGKLTNHRYTEFKKDALIARPFNKFAYMTPLNGGEGFTFEKEVELFEFDTASFERGETCISHHNHIHTISVERCTVLLLTQFRDELPPEAPTAAYRADSKSPPSLVGLYDHFTTGQLVNRLHQLEAMGITF